MTKITFLPCSLLLPFGVLVTLSTGELEFYEDVIPETSEENTLKELAKYLETEHLLHHYPFFLPDNSHKKKHYQPFNPIRQFDPRVFGNPDTGIARPETYFPRERSISPDEIFTRNSNHENLNQLLKEQKLWNLPEDDEISGLAPDVKHDSSYYNMNFLPKLNLDVNEYGSNKNNEYNIYNYGKYRAKSWDLPEFAQPKFTYRFGKANLSEKSPFAVGPNDPRYYQDAPLSFDGNPEVPEETKSNGNANRMDFHMDENYDDKNYKNYKSPEPTGDRQMVDIPQSKFHPVESNNLPLEVDRREEDDVDDNNNSNDDESSNSGPVIISVKTDPNNDIYFIAIVAGCSAAAMFTLVLISLTWCRLQRGAKAAADIEYPAYGITGPNKDISPSGDQRLAQSAQMYHFQHQKQQIIAMENRTAATRDPGSLSEAESDEENEEGDYTVYECPGLAPAGEMEVKNPLFHDDPTPATPAQSKDEDHVQ